MKTSHQKSKCSHHLIPIFTLLFFFYLSLSSEITYPRTTLQPYDRKILLRIQEHFGGQNATFWNSSSPDCCVYCYDQSVRCNDDGHVVGLFLSSDPNLFGSIPLAISDLTSLQYLSLDGPGFMGRIPPSIGKLTNLQFLAIINTSMTGAIPSSLGRLKNLTRINLSNNKLSGPIPDSLAQLTNLWELDLSSNMLSGPIPNSIGRLTSLTNLMLNSNRLSGRIPVSIGLLVNVNVVFLHENRLSGPIPDCFGLFKNRFDLWLYDNQLTGSVPKSMGQASFWTLDLTSNKLTDASVLFNKSEFGGSVVLNLCNNLLKFDFSKVGFFDQINGLNISHNMIYGPLPKQLGQLPRLSSLDVSYNHLCGPIPDSAILKKFSAVNYGHNKCLCGSPLPPCK